MQNSLAPLLDLDAGKEYKPQTLQEMEINPNLTKMFGFTEQMGVGYTLSNYPVSPTAIGEMFRNAERSIMPAGYIPSDYTGIHPKITSWGSWNKAKSDNLNIMFGDLTKGRLLYIDVPNVAKQPFTLEGTKPMSEKGDIYDSIDRKGKIEADFKCRDK